MADQHEPTEHVATGRVTTDAAPRYVKQLASHLGRRAEVRDETGGTRVVFEFGSCLLLARDTELELVASAGNAEDLDGVKDVVARHIERFGQRNALRVTWQ